jgi:hypothetical protein
MNRAINASKVALRGSFAVAIARMGAPMVTDGVAGHQHARLRNADPQIPRDVGQ